jgi:hypothetical protein
MGGQGLVEGMAAKVVVGWRGGKAAVSWREGSQSTQHRTPPAKLWVWGQGWGWFASWPAGRVQCKCGMVRGTIDCA